jgi:hypothetical protein
MEYLKLDINDFLVIGIVIFLLIRYSEILKRILTSIAERIEKGDPVKISNIVTLGRSTGKLTAPKDNGKVTDDHIAIVHRSWLRKDKESSGKKIYQIHLALYGQEETLNKVEYVIYRLDPAYKEPTRFIDDRSKQFGFYELANGYSLVRAEVKIKNQYEPVLLSRFIDLSESTDSIKESGYLE